MNIRKAIEERFLEKIEMDNELISKEFDESAYDFEKAQKAFEEEDYKWSIVKSYYSVFHSAKAMLFALGLKERKHFAISIVLEDLNLRGKLESIYVNDFKAASSAREDADYHYSYSKKSALHILEIAEEFNDKMEKLVKEL
ncbi:HEPN domain-containing protein [Candidatus Woesearchaeota archaeon]|nr:HEPN domain-containing protein [Candidatus Woesearchaeota archaeon]